MEREGYNAERRLAGAPISWGVCEVPGWGLMLPPERVLSEMASLGLAATELGPVGYLSLDAGRVRDLLEQNGLQVVGGFVPLVLHESSLNGARDVLEPVASLLAELGGDVIVVAPVSDDGWSSSGPLEEHQWRHMAEHLDAVAELVDAKGLTLALHPHIGALVEREEDIERVLANSAVALCLDTGHLTIAGADPVELARRHAERIAHVHLKDVSFELAERVRSGELSLLEGTRRGLFRPLGDGDADIAEVVGLLDRHGYERWLVLEQDTTITGEEPPVGRGPVLDVRRSIEYLATLAPANRGGVPQQ
jgi:inosose dehydratase